MSSKLNMTDEDEGIFEYNENNRERNINAAVQAIALSGATPLILPSRFLQPLDGRDIPGFDSKKLNVRNKNSSIMDTATLFQESQYKNYLTIITNMVRSEDDYTRISALEWLHGLWGEESLLTLGNQGNTVERVPLYIRQMEVVRNMRLQALKEKAIKEYGRYTGHPSASENGLLFLTTEANTPEEALHLLSQATEYCRLHIRVPAVITAVLSALANRIPLSGEARRQLMAQLHWNEEDLEQQLMEDVRAELLSSLRKSNSIEEKTEKAASKRAPVKVASVADIDSIHPTTGVMIKCYESSKEEGFFNGLSPLQRMEAIIGTMYPIKNPFRDLALMEQVEAGSLSTEQALRLRDAFYDIRLADEVAENLHTRMSTAGELESFRTQMVATEGGASLLAELQVENPAKAPAWKTELFDLLCLFPIPSFRRDELLEQLTNRRPKPGEANTDVPGSGDHLMQITKWYVDSGALRNDEHSTRRMLEMNFVFSIIRQLNRNQRIDLLLVVMEIEVSNRTSREVEQLIRRRIPGFGMNSSRLTRHEQEQILLELYEGEDNGIFTTPNESRSTRQKSEKNRLLQNISQYIVREGDESTRLIISNLIYRTLEQCHWSKRIQLTQDLMAFQRRGKTMPEMVASMLCSLGPVFMKGGQQEGQQSWVPRQYREPLMHLNDSTPELPKEKILDVVQREVGLNHYLYIGEPIGSASLAQVHRAILKKGTIVRTEEGETYRLTHESVVVQGNSDGESLTLENGCIVECAETGQKITIKSKPEGKRAIITEPTEVALKVLRPGVRKQIHTDLELATDIIGFVNANPKIFGMSINEGLKDELKDSILEQIDLRKEVERRDQYAQAVDALKPKLATLELSEVTVPKVVCPELTTRRVVNYEYVRGIPITGEKRLEACAQYMGLEGLAEVREWIAMGLLTVQVGSLLEARHGQRDPNRGNAFLIPSFGFRASGQTRAKVHRAIAAMNANSPVAEADRLTVKEGRKVGIGLSLLDYGHIEENPELYKEQLQHLFWAAITADLSTMEQLLYEFHIGTHLRRGASSLEEVPALRLESLRDNLVEFFEEEFGETASKLMDATQEEEITKERFKQILSSLAKNHNFGTVFNRLLDILYEHGIVIPKEVMSILRSFRIGSYITEWITAEQLLEFLKKVTPQSVSDKFKERAKKAMEAIIPQGVRNLIRSGIRNIPRLRAAMEEESEGKPWHQALMDGVRDAQISEWFEKLKPKPRRYQIITVNDVEQYKTLLQQGKLKETGTKSPEGKYQLGVEKIQKAFKVDRLPQGTLIQFWVKNTGKRFAEDKPADAMVECTYVIMDPFNFESGKGVKALRHDRKVMPKISLLGPQGGLLARSIVNFNGKWMSGADLIKFHESGAEVSDSGYNIAELSQQVPQPINDYLDRLEERIHSGDKLKD